MKWLVIALLLIGIAAAECIEPTDGMTIKENILFCSSTYDIPNGITIGANDVVLDCGTAVLRGIVGESEIGIRAENVDRIAIKNCNILTFTQGIYLKNVTNSLIENNAILKNRIGIRILDSYENTIRDNNDKSFQFAVSAINSKYNVVILGNKEIERAFCEVNACNEFRDMNVCESGDFYCSKKCSPQTDADCVLPPPVLIVEKVNATEKVEKIIEETKKEVEQQIAKNETKVVKIEQQNFSWPIKIFIYLALYSITLIVLRTVKKR